jgi:hypothetical protein
VSAGWIVGNADQTRWRAWREGEIGWTEKREDATRYARREDAESVHREDEDAWFVVPYCEPSAAPAVSVEAKLAQFLIDRPVNTEGWEHATVFIEGAKQALEWAAALHDAEVTRLRAALRDIRDCTNEDGGAAEALKIIRAALGEQP